MDIVGIIASTVYQCLSQLFAGCHTQQEVSLIWVLLGKP